MSDVLLRAESLSKEYDSGVVVRAVNDVSLTVSRGEVMLIIGPNGSGKTTLLSMLGGLMRPTRGTIHLGDRALHELSDAALTDFRLRHVGFVFQGFRLLDVLSVRENVQLVVEMAVQFIIDQVPAQILLRTLEKSVQGHLHHKDDLAHDGLLLFTAGRGPSVRRTLQPRRGGAVDAGRQLLAVPHFQPLANGAMRSEPAASCRNRSDAPR